MDPPQLTSMRQRKNRVIFSGVVACLDSALPRDIKMPECVKKVLDFNETHFQETMGPHLGPNARTYLTELSERLKIWPRGDTGNSFGFPYGISLTVVTCVFVAVRLYCRKYVTPQRILPEDWICCLALVLTMATTGLSYDMLSIFNRHQWELVGTEMQKLVKFWFMITVMGIVDYFAAKMIFFVCYYRLMGTDRTFRIWLLTYAGLFSAYCFAGVLVSIFTCRPIDVWNHITERKCLHGGIPLMVGGIAMMVTDIFLMILPIWQVRRMNFPRKEKWLLIALFGASGLIPALSVLRMISLYEAYHTQDISASSGPQMFWILFELYLSIIISCAPAVKSLFTHRSENPRNKSLREMSVSTSNKPSEHRHSAFTPAVTPEPQNHVHQTQSEERLGSMA